MTASATTSINGDASQVAHSVTYGSTVTLTLVSTTDVTEATFAFLSSNTGGTSFPTISRIGLGEASFIMPADPGGGAGAGYLLQTIVNPGQSSQSISSRIVGHVSSLGVVPLCPGETTERSASLGWLAALKTAVPGL